MQIRCHRQEFDYEAPVKLLDKMLHAQAENVTQQVQGIECCVLSFEFKPCLCLGNLQAAYAGGRAQR